MASELQVGLLKNQTGTKTFIDTSAETIDNIKLGSTVVLGTNASPIASNLVLAAGNGIDFSAASGSAAGSSSAVLDDYEEGTWTATLASGATTTPTQTARYIKVGNVVHVSLNGSFGNMTVNGTAIEISGLPFTTSSNSDFNPTGTIGNFARADYQASSHHFCSAASNSTTVLFRYIPANTGSPFALLSQSTGNYTPNSAFQMTYFID